MTEKFLDAFSSELEEIVKDLHKRIGAHIEETCERTIDVTPFTEPSLLRWSDSVIKRMHFIFLDSHSGKAMDTGSPSFEFLCTLRILFLFEVIRQSSHIHTSRGKIKDTQYAWAKQLLLKYFERFKGLPDILEEKES